MRLDELKPGMMRECVDHYRLDKLDDGAGGFVRDFTLQNESLRVAWEESPPVNRVTGEVLSQRTTVQMGIRASVDIQSEDLIVHDGTVYRVIGAREKKSRRWKIEQLEQRDERDVPQQTT